MGGGVEVIAATIIVQALLALAALTLLGAVVVDVLTGGLGES